MSHPAKAQSAEEEIQTSFRAGQAALRQGDFQLAAEDFKKVLALDPDLIEAQANLGLAYQSLLNYDAAARSLAHVLLERPNLAGLNIIVGMDYLKLGDPATAAPYLRRALQLTPSSADAHEAMALYDLTQENFQGTLEQYRAVSGLNPDKAEALFKAGHQYLDLSARLAYRGARLYPDSPWGHRFLGDMLAERARWEDAAQEYKKALAIEPRQGGLHTLIGETYLQSGKLQDAEAEFHRELTIDTRSEQASLGLVRVQLATGRAMEALETATQVWQSSIEYLKAHPELPPITITREVAQSCIALLENQPEGGAKHLLLAALYASIGENDRSESEAQALQNALSTWQKTAHLQTPAARSACSLHLYARCIASLKQTRPLTNAAHLQLGKIYFVLQEYESAAEQLAQVHGDKISTSEASYWLEKTCQSLGAEAFTQLETSFSGSWRTHQLRAEGFALRRDHDAVVKEYDAALQLRPDEAELHEALGEFYLDNRSDDEARKELEKSEAADPSRTKTLYLLGRLYVLDGENEKAVPVLERALQLQPNLDEANGLLGTAYIRMEKFAEAIPKLEKAAPLDHIGNIDYQLYQAYKKLGNNELAQKALIRSQEIRRSSLEHDQALIMGSPRTEPDPQ